MRDAEKLLWQLDHAETELWKKPSDPLLDKVAAMITEDTPEWNGSATELVLLLQVEGEIAHKGRGPVSFVWNQEDSKVASHKRNK